MFSLRSQPTRQFALVVAIGLLGSACASTPNPTVELPSNNDFDRVSQILAEKYDDDTASLVVDSLERMSKTESGSSPGSTIEIPPDSAVSDAEKEQLLQLAAEGAFYNQPESEKLRLFAENWELTFGTPATAEDIVFAQSAVENFTAQIAAGAWCVDLDSMMDALAATMNTDLRRTEYAFGPAFAMWMPPQQLVSFLTCFS